MDITSAAIATLISAATSATITLLLTRLNSRKSLDEQLDAILKIAIQYPYLESKDFTSTWTSSYNRNDEKALRYEVYCTLVFNYMSRLAKYHKYCEDKIDEHVALKPWARIHARYWRDPTEAYENVDTYDRPFVALVEGYLKGK
ncbi:hypothetical protein EZJ19_07975 [Parasulfuritortus cantonensis]|uniref:Uncharacterized protein n=1 Tax=Parasulfuritortus cantonensis TaxID=2528202 RepID=A0A4R1BDN7_9PROT|nr:hypothetical protein [Parasulfuritortus cantonensis]TCJ15236.1 hypothetical protein EZJ19_07975 [Parasulfuritortus cantonensis]